ncbi:galactose/methyl galactoside import ATP-binding protein MglA [bacterium BMS3Bbin02]|nr:galactose/methyl galactoside import ATP-binding protein MglA [bacterium BMS3Bbin02]HDH26538.1 ABC transporter ATP-binding protein [Actinomycetota bacterium]
MTTTQPGTQHQLVVEMRDITKKFPGVIANEDVTLEVRRGEIHALLGENGAGKSTLMSVLCGLYQPDGGSLHLALHQDELHQIVLRSPRHAIHAGIGMVYQHFKLIPTFSVAENVLLGAEDTPTVLDLKQAGARIKEIGERFGLPVNPEAKVWQLSVGEQQRVEILKQLYRGASLLILDEPTAVLTPQESDALGETMHSLAASGVSIVFISHKLDEVIAYADRVTVLRDGKTAATVDVVDVTKADLARLMVGRDVLFSVEKADADLGADALVLDHVTALGDRSVTAVNDISLTVRGGEILGIAGVAGNGQKELVEVMTGLRTPTAGSITVRGNDLTGKSAIDFIRGGVAHVPADRLGQGLAGNLPLTDNVILKSFRSEPISRRSFLNKKAIHELSTRLIAAFNVLPGNPDAPASGLSGGNQQKLILAREIDATDRLAVGDEPAVLVAVYPTRGLDVGAIEIVRDALLNQRAIGAAVVMVSEDLDELRTLSDRIAVLHGGEVMGIVDPKTTSKDDLGLLMAGERLS